MVNCIIFVQWGSGVGLGGVIQVGRGAQRLFNVTPIPYHPLYVFLPRLLQKRIRRTRGMAMGGGHGTQIYLDGMTITDTADMGHGDGTSCCCCVIGRLITIRVRCHNFGNIGHGKYFLNIIDSWRRVRSACIPATQS